MGCFLVIKVWDFVGCVAEVGYIVFGFDGLDWGLCYLGG